MATGANEIQAVVESFKAARDLSACQYKGVYISADDTVDVMTALKMSGGYPLQNKPAAAGRAARVLFVGKSKVYLSGTVTAGDTIACTTSGWYIKVTSGVSACGFVTKTANSGYIGEAIMGISPTLAANSYNAGQI